VSTLKKYLVSVAFAHSLRGLPSPTSSDRVLLKRMVKAHRRWRGVATKQKRPITVALLHLFHEHVSGPSLEHRVLWAVMCVGVHGMARLGELLPDVRVHSSRVLRHSAVTFLSSTQAIIRLHSSKTDPNAKGSVLRLFATGDVTCPVAALQAIWREPKVGVPDGPLFATTRAQLTRREFIVSLRRVVGLTEQKHKIGLQRRLFAGHSLRRGGATSLMLRGVPNGVIQLLGRWASDAYRLYLDHPIELIEKHFRLLAKDGKSQSVFELDMRAALCPSLNPSNVWSE
jgi:hypothetical protein